MGLPTNHYLLAACRSAYRDTIVAAAFPENWHLVSNRDELAQALTAVEPRYIFFLHWSWIVPAELLDHWECVCFHMTDVPFGRGGSPLQNLISRGHRGTKLSALRMTDEIDAGPVYLKEELSLEGGTAEEIYLRACRLSLAMARRIADREPTPLPQNGEPTIFPRRKAAESEIGELPDLLSLHDFIRMLDAEGYPKAFVSHRGFRLEFSRSALYHDRLVADVTITREEREER